MSLAAPTFTNSASKCRQKFLRVFPKGFYDPQYLNWERNYKVEAHKQWQSNLSRDQFEKLLALRQFSTIAHRAVQIEGRTHLLFSFEKMALRDAVRDPLGAQSFAEGLHAFIYSKVSSRSGFELMNDKFAILPHEGTRARTWPALTVFGFLARPRRHIFLKPNTMRKAAELYGYNFHYLSKPSWEVYADFLKFARLVKLDLSDLHPRDFIDVQSFLWVVGSEEYAEH